MPKKFDFLEIDIKKHLSLAMLSYIKIIPTLAARNVFSKNHEHPVKGHISFNLKTHNQILYSFLIF